MDVDSSFYLDVIGVPLHPTHGSVVTKSYVHILTFSPSPMKDRSIGPFHRVSSFGNFTRYRHSVSSTLLLIPYTLCDPQNRRLTVGIHVKWF